MFCEVCGSKLKDKAKFCGGCGTKLETAESISANQALNSIAIAPLPTGVTMATVPVEILGMSGEGPDNENNLNITVRCRCRNDSTQNWNLLKIRMQLLNSYGQIIDETIDIREELIEADSEYEWEALFWSINASLLGLEPEKAHVIVYVSASQKFEFQLDKINIPENPFSIVNVASKSMDAIQLVGCSVWKGAMDDDKESRVVVKALIQNLTSANLPLLKILAVVSDKKGKELIAFDGEDELKAGELVVVNASSYTQDKKLIGATAALSINMFWLIASGLSQAKGMKIEMSVNDNGYDELVSDVNMAFEWQMQRAEINIDEIEEDDIREALTLVYNLAKEQKYEEAVNSLPPMNFEFSFSNLDSDASEFFDDINDLSIDMDLSNSNHKIRIGLNQDKLIISANIIFKLKLRSDINYDDLNEWLGDNGGYSAGFLSGGWSYNGDEGGSLQVISDNNCTQDDISDIKIFETGVDETRAASFYLRSDNAGGFSSSVAYCILNGNIIGAFYGYVGGGEYDGGFFKIDQDSGEFSILSYDDIEEEDNSQVFNSLMQICGQTWDDDDSSILSEDGNSFLESGEDTDDGGKFCMFNNFDGDSLSEISEHWNISLRF